MIEYGRNLLPKRQILEWQATSKQRASDDMIWCLRISPLCCLLGCSTNLQFEWYQLFVYEEEWFIFCINDQIQQLTMLCSRITQPTHQIVQGLLWGMHLFSFSSHHLLHVNVSIMMMMIPSH
jgi:hypothetical protein